VIEPREAWRRLLGHLTALPAERVARRRAFGRVLAEPLAATLDVPFADVSAMDGYALAAPEERASEPVGGGAAGGAAARGGAAGEGGGGGFDLPVAGVVAAGDPPGATLPPGAALRIMTGAPLPAGADRVVPLEDTDRGRERVVVERLRGPGANVRRRGEIVAAGADLLPAGAPLTAGAMALLAAHGHAEVAVHAAPRVALLVTGDEVVAPEDEPGPGQLRDTHTDFLLAAGAALGLEFESLGRAPDREDELRRRIAAGLADADVLLVSGGVSKGEFDLVEGVLAALGCRPLFTAVAIQPGKPLVAAAGPEGGRTRLVFGLPGNPGAVAACYWLFVRPALRRLMGHRDGWLHGLVAGELAAPAPGAKDRHLFVPAEIEADGGPLRVFPLPTRGSHDLAATARGTALLWVPPRTPPRKAGEPCSVLPIG
jgi:molybdopterin molybdotransferase